MSSDECTLCLTNHCGSVDVHFLMQSDMFCGYNHTTTVLRPNTLLIYVFLFPLNTELTTTNESSVSSTPQDQAFHSPLNTELRNTNECCVTLCPQGQAFPDNHPILTTTFIVHWKLQGFLYIKKQINVNDNTCCRLIAPAPPRLEVTSCNVSPFLITGRF